MDIKQDFVDGVGRGNLYTDDSWVAVSDLFNNEAAEARKELNNLYARRSVNRIFSIIGVILFFCFIALSPSNFQYFDVMSALKVFSFFIMVTAIIFVLVFAVTTIVGIFTDIFIPWIKGR